MVADVHGVADGLERGQQVAGEKKLQGVRFRVPPVLPLREVGRWFSAVQGPNRLYRGEK